VAEASICLTIDAFKKGMELLFARKLTYFWRRPQDKRARRSMERDREADVEKKVGEIIRLPR
jgi:hypothetical protein